MMPIGTIRRMLAVFTLLPAVALAAAIPPPHPIITEVLFNVPPAPAGDANKDGTRHATADEFVEIANPHDSPINLKGYVLFSRRSSFGGSAAGGVRFVFPDFELAPGGVCVVFNGFDASIPPPVGTADGAPDRGHPAFGGATLFTMEIRSKGRALANNGDWIVLSAPDGTPIDCVVWGDPDPPPPPDVLRRQAVDPDPKGSVQRLTPDGDLVPHRDINGEPFSPGIIPKRTKSPSPPKPKK